MSFSDTINEFLTQYPKGLSSWDEAFDNHPFIREINQKFEIESQTQLPVWNDLVETLSKKYFKVLSNFGLSLKSFDLTIKAAEHDNFFIDVSVSLLVPFHCIICHKDKEDIHLMRIETYQSEYQQYIDEIDTEIKLKFDSTLHRQ